MSKATRRIYQYKIVTRCICQRNLKVDQIVALPQIAMNKSVHNTRGQRKAGFPDTLQQGRRKLQPEKHLVTEELQILSCFEVNSIYHMVKRMVVAEVSSGCSLCLQVSPRLVERNGLNAVILNKIGLLIPIRATAAKSWLATKTPAATRTLRSEPHDHDFQTNTTRNGAAQCDRDSCPYNPL